MLHLLGATEAYDPVRDAWTERTPMPTPRGGLAGTAAGGLVLAAGGEGPDGTFEDVAAYDPETDEWDRLPSLPTPRHGLGVAVVAGHLFAAAGGPTPGFDVSDALEILPDVAAGR